MDFDAVDFCRYINHFMTLFICIEKYVKDLRPTYFFLGIPSATNYLIISLVYWISIQLFYVAPETEICARLFVRNIEMRLDREKV